MFSHAAGRTGPLAGRGRWLVAGIGVAVLAAGYLILDPFGGDDSCVRARDLDGIGESDAPAPIGACFEFNAVGAVEGDDANPPPDLEVRLTKVEEADPTELAPELFEGPGEPPPSDAPAYVATFEARWLVSEEQAAAFSEDGGVDAPGEGGVEVNVELCVQFDEDDREDPSPCPVIHGGTVGECTVEGHDPFPVVPLGETFEFQQCVLVLVPSGVWPDEDTDGDPALFDLSINRDENVFYVFQP